MIETALEVSQQKVTTEIISQIINIGKRMLEHPVILLDDVEKTLKTLKDKNFKLIVATKGDLIDQERKLKKSGLLHYFHHIEVMSEKGEENYQALFKQLNIKASDFLMIGNSLKSDIIPVVNLGGKAIHVPYHTTWAHEEASDNLHENDFLTIKKLGDLLM
jgi:putative hydrolase of the HAD superfamily